MGPQRSQSVPNHSNIHQPNTKKTQERKTNNSTSQAFSGPDLADCAKRFQSIGTFGTISNYLAPEHGPSLHLELVAILLLIPARLMATY